MPDDADQPPEVGASAALALLGRGSDGGPEKAATRNPRPAIAIHPVRIIHQLDVGPLAIWYVQ